MQDNVEALFLASDPFRGGASLRLHTEVRGVERPSAGAARATG
jgi:hypothetical protein